jgi:hypothetical protein
MAGAVFTSSVSYTPGGGGSLTQGFRVAFTYSAVSSGTIDIASGSSAAQTIQFAGVGTALGFVVQNNTDADIHVSLNGSANLFRVAQGGVVMHWAPEAPAATPLSSATITPVTPTEDGSVDYIVLGT